jgi:hypothetical protein
MSTHDETICGATRNEGRLNSTEVEGNVGDLLGDLPLLVALIVIIGVKRIYLAKSRCKSLFRTHDCGKTYDPGPETSHSLS